MASKSAGTKQRRASAGKAASDANAPKDAGRPEPRAEGAPSRAPTAARATPASATKAEATPAPSAPKLGLDGGVLRAGLSLLLLAAMLVPEGPFDFLPLVARLPLATIAVAALGWPALTRAAASLPSWAPLAAEGVAVAAVLALYLLFKVVGLHPSDTDDNIYFYMAKRLAEGAVPYRDFFFAHPPVHLLVPALVFRVFGFSIGVAKAIPALAQAAAGLLLYRAGRRASPALGVLAMLLHLTAYEVLMASTDMDGENILTAFLVASFALALGGRLVAAGVCAGLALGTGVYALAGVVALGLVLVVAEPRRGARFAGGLAVSMLAWGGGFRALGGPGFTEGVFTYHFAKVPAEGYAPLFDSLSPFAMAGAFLHNLARFLGGRSFDKSLYYHAPLYVAAALGFGLFVAARVKGDPASPLPRWRRPFAAMLEPTATGLAGLGALTTALFLAELASLRELYDYYYVPMLPFVALSAAAALLAAYEGARAATTPRALLLPAGLGAAFCAHLPLAEHEHSALWPEEDREAGAVQSYPWREPDAAVWAAPLARALFYKDHRVKGRREPHYRHYIWNKSLGFSRDEVIGEYVRANSAPHETLTGASTLAPLIALRAGRRLAMDEADTNNKRFRVGMLTDYGFFDRACRDNIRFIVAASRSHFTDEAMAADPTVTRYFERVMEFEEPRIRHFRADKIVLYRRKDAAEPLPDGRVCEAVPR